MTDHTDTLTSPAATADAHAMIARLVTSLRSVMLGRDAIIEDCTFRNCTGPGVLVMTELVHFHESIGTRNVTVRNNLFEHCNQGAATAEAALATLAWLKNSAYPPQPGVHRDVRFEGAPTGEAVLAGDVELRLRELGGRLGVPEGGQPFLGGLAQPFKAWTSRERR